MAWEWSHSSDAYENAKENLENKDKDWLDVVWAEWQANTNREKDPNAFNEKKYQKALKKAQSLPHDALVEDVWDKMNELRTCTNGGWQAWCCPFGCHLVSFDKEEPN